MSNLKKYINFSFKGELEIYLVYINGESIILRDLKLLIAKQTKVNCQYFARVPIELVILDAYTLKEFKDIYEAIKAYSNVLVTRRPLNTISKCSCYKSNSICLLCAQASPRLPDISTQGLTQLMATEHPIFHKLVGATFLIVKYKNSLDMEVALYNNKWPICYFNLEILNNLWEQRSNIILIFSQNGSSKIQGVAKMKSRVEVIHGRMCNFELDWVIQGCKMSFSQIYRIRNYLNNNEPITKSRNLQEIPYDIGVRIVTDCYLNVENNIKLGNESADEYMNKIYEANRVEKDKDIIIHIESNSNENSCNTQENISYTIHNNNSNNKIISNPLCLPNNCSYIQNINHTENGDLKQSIQKSRDEFIARKRSSSIKLELNTEIMQEKGEYYKEKAENIFEKENSGILRREVLNISQYTQIYGVSTQKKQWEYSPALEQSPEPLPTVEIYSRRSWEVLGGLKYSFTTSQNERFLHNLRKGNCRRAERKIIHKVHLRQRSRFSEKS